jgi:DNA-binding transcriptional MerR regulator
VGGVPALDLGCEVASSKVSNRGPEVVVFLAKRERTRHEVLSVAIDFVSIVDVYVNVMPTLRSKERLMSDRTWTIGELADEFDTTLRTIRFYEDRGLLAPERRGSTRIFHDRDRVRLQLILRGRRLGFTLDEIAHVINMYDETPGERGQLAFLIADIDKRREALLAKRRDLDEALAELDDLERRCQTDLERLSESR